MSKAQQHEAAQLLGQIQQKWEIAQQTFCLGIDIKYPHVNLNVLFNGIIQTGNNAAINGIQGGQGGSNFWHYFQKGTMYINTYVC